MIKKGTWIEIEEVVLTTEHRALNIPKETKETPLKCWIRGYCLNDCNLGEEVEVETNVGRIVKGKVVEIEPGYYHSYGKHVSEIDRIGKQAREIIGNIK
ncbi:2-amino-4-oxopentanoate thiolase subunit OrtA [Clostridium amazonitimonense]|uniref:2-amino-4-oxopentanoate thiolase subunit OrtA n=1 Tax=Clostridium amazonitimonense TaxID=1499689 RepID=UPI0005094A25|nr:2-amino-4-oxopentanoate thiolase subunit OrtA [Clostridium amazonitimonense]